MPFFRLLLFIVSCCFISAAVVAQETATDTSCEVKQLGDLFRKKNKAVEKPPKSYYLLVTPVISSSPATGFVIGFASQVTFKGKQPDAKYSLISANAQYTTKNQALFNVKNNVFLANNRLFLSGDWRIFFFSQPTYGLSTDVILLQEDHDHLVLGDQFVDPDSIAEPMKFNYFKFHQTASWNFSGFLYLGGGIHFDIYESIRDEKLDTANEVFTHHYEYSVAHQFNPEHYGLNGFSANIIFDTRDNQINASKGWFANVNWRYNPKFSSAKQNSSLLFAELRFFKTIRVKRSAHTVGWWVWGNFVTSGQVPYLTLPSVGWDQRSRSGRGYPQGMFRGNSMAYGEFEYRFPITCNQLLGGVFFINATTASDRDREVHLFKYIQPAVGFGLRLLMDKSTRTNLVLDYAKGRKSGGFYLNAGETF